MSINITLPDEVVAEARLMAAKTFSPELVVIAALTKMVEIGMAISAYGSRNDDDSYSAATWATALEPVLIIRLGSGEKHE